MTDTYVFLRPSILYAVYEVLSTRITLAVPQKSHTYLPPVPVLVEVIVQISAKITCSSTACPIESNKEYI